MKKSIVKIVTEDVSFHSCGIVRGAMPAFVLNKSDMWNVTVKPLSALSFSDCVGTDVMIFQRVFDPSMIPIVTELRKQGARILFDIDDALWLLPKQHSDKDFSSFSITFPASMCKQLFDFIARYVDLTLVSTPELQTALKIAVPGCVTALVGNYVLPQFFPAPAKVVKESFDVCWYAAGGHNHQAEFAYHIFERVLNGDTARKTKIHLVGIATKFNHMRKLVENFNNRVVLHDWIEYTKLGMFLNTMDCVVCPIVAHPFTHCKSEVKAVEAGMSGAVPIMSVSPQYTRFADKTMTPNEKVVCLLSDSVEEWVNVLRSPKDFPSSLSSLPQRVDRAYGFTSMVENWGSVLKQVLVDEVFYKEPFMV